MPQPSSATILICNAGSSSLKLALYDGQDQCLAQQDFAGNADALVNQFAAWLARQRPVSVALHRIVHGGARTEGSYPLDAQALESIAHWATLAPLHNRLALALIETLANLWPDSRQYGLFDSGLFHDLPDVARHYALPAALSPQWPVLRYGFHGLAHRAQWRALQQRSRQQHRPEYSRIISLHLGSGCSATAWHEGQVLDTSMGFSPLEGLAMATRCGNIDPSILMHLMQQEGFDAQTLHELLNRESGLKGLSGKSGDVRDLLDNADPRAVFALEFFCYQIRKMIGAYLAVLGGLDAISIGGGIGEHQPRIRARILEPLAGLGIKLGPRNQDAKGLCALHAGGSDVELWLTPVNEMAEMLTQYRNRVAAT